MFLLSLVSTFLIAMLLLSLFIKVRPLARAEMPGKVLKVMPLGLAARFRLHGSALSALATGLTLMVIVGALPWLMALLVAGLALAIACLPLNYTFTTQGVGLGPALFRRWDEFNSVRVERGRVRLAHPSFFGRLTLYVAPEALGSVLDHIRRRVSSPSVIQGVEAR